MVASALNLHVGSQQHWAALGHFGGIDRSLIKGSHVSWRSKLDIDLDLGNEWPDAITVKSCCGLACICTPLDIHQGLGVHIKVDKAIKL